MAVVLAVTAVIAWLQFFEVSWAPWEVKIDRQNRSPEGPWGLLEAS